MKRISLIVFLLIGVACGSIAQEKPTKNVILMIPDGTSLATVSSARWYQRYNNPEQKNLFIDPYICGTVLTFSSNAPIGDSAPTTSCYMTGVPSRAGWVSTYPVVDQLNDIVPLDPTKAYQPLVTVLEAMRLSQNKATGLVFTCEFAHATPADCSAHSYSRGKYNWIVPQMVHNGLDVVIGGGTSLLTDDLKAYLKGEGYGVFSNNLDSLREFKGNKMWALFGDMDMAYELDRNPEEQPSIAEMTGKAIEKLSTNENGFFLMVEGSKVDWAAHANDPAAMITDMLAFDKACGVAIDFAKKNQETVVVILPDHGNSGISIGARRCSNYSTMTKNDLFQNVSRYKTSGEGLCRKLAAAEPSDFKAVVKEWTGIELSDNELAELQKCATNAKNKQLSNEERMKGSDFVKVIARILDEHTCFGFTTGGHTGEEVFLAVYDPTPNRITGFKTNQEINAYLAQSAGLEVSLEDLTETYFSKHTDVFKGYTYNIIEDPKKPGAFRLEVTNKKKKNKLVITPNTNIVTLNKKEVKLNSVVIYVDKNNTFYLPQSLSDLLK